MSDKAESKEDRGVVEKTCVKQTQTQTNTKNKLPKEYLENGGPGRPLGSKNKFTIIKNIIAETFLDKDVKGKERYKQKAMTEEGFKQLIKDILVLMPKETKLSGETGLNITITSEEWNRKKELIDNAHREGILN